MAFGLFMLPKKARHLCVKSVVFVSCLYGTIPKWSTEEVLCLIQPKFKIKENKGSMNHQENKGSIIPTLKEKCDWIWENWSKLHIYKSKKYLYKYSIQYISGTNLAASTQLSMNIQLFRVFQFINYLMDS